MSGKISTRIHAAARRMANPRSNDKMQRRNGGFYYVYDNYKRITRNLKKLYRIDPKAVNTVIDKVLSPQRAKRAA